jgi:hypothetical protein
MLKTKTFSAILAAALIAGAMTMLPGVSAQVSASSPLNHGKGDRLDIRPIGANCSEQAWPYYDAKCLKDARQPMGIAKPVRIVSADRVAR